MIDLKDKKDFYGDDPKELEDQKRCVRIRNSVRNMMIDSQTKKFGVAMWGFVLLPERRKVKSEHEKKKDNG